MKTNRRLKATADLRNHPHGYVVLDLVDFDGGEFDLHPRIGEIQVSDNEFKPALYLPSSEAPGYRLVVTGTPEILERFANALRVTARNADAEE